MPTQKLKDDALAIWQAGVSAVRSERLVSNVISRNNDELTICGHHRNLSAVDRIAVVGAGKAGAGMAAAVEASLGADVVSEKVSGWVNVPADCVRTLKKIHLHAARPASVNEPTAEGVVGSEKILELVGQLTPRDLCLVLISGGGSALLPAPIPPLTLDDKQQTTRYLMHHGADILAMNTVRKRLSRIKGGKLAAACKAQKMIALIISDIVDDPLDMIASGPTVADPGTDQAALQVLQELGASPPEVPRSVFDYLEKAVQQGAKPTPIPDTVFNHIIGNNSFAVSASQIEAEKRGYQVVSLGSANTGEASQEGRELADRCVSIRNSNESEKPICVLSGGEPIVDLAPGDVRGKGGRNQQLVLAAMDQLKSDGMTGIAILSGGTDGEDGPTNAAGALADESTLQMALDSDLDLQTSLQTNDAYSFFEELGEGLIKTGPTHTNVMDLRVALIQGNRRLDSGTVAY